MTEKDLKKDFDNRYEDAHSKWQYWQREANDDLKCRLGDQWSSQDKAYLIQQRRSVLSFNKILRICNMIGGYQKKNRLALRVEGVEQSDEQTASQFSALLMYIMQSGGGYKHMSDAFDRGPITTGLSLIYPYMDYTDDLVNGDIKFKVYPFNKFMIDPAVVSQDLDDDCDFITIREYVTRNQAKALIPEKAGFIQGIHIKGKDNRYLLAPDPREGIGEAESMRWDEYWYRDYDKVDIIIDGKTGKQFEWPKDAPKEEFEKIKQIEGVEVITKMRPVVKLAIFIEDQLVYHDYNPNGNQLFSHVALWGYYYPEYKETKLKLQGVVRAMRDPQEEVNKRRSKILDIIDSQITTGWKALSGKVVNPKSLYGSGQGQVIWLEESMEDAERLQAPSIPDGLFRIQEVMDKDIMEIPGANSEMLGMPESEQLEVATLLAKMRQGAGLTILQGLFDSYRESKKKLGNKLIELIQKNFLADKVKRIINENPTQQFYDEEFGKYDCVPTEGVITDTQKQQYFAQLRDLQAAGAPIPWAEIIRASSLERKEDLAKAIEEQEKSAAEIQKIELESKVLENEMSKSRIEQDYADAQEKRAQAKENIANMLLDRVKTARQIEESDEKKIIEILKLITKLQLSAEKPTQPQINKR